MIGPLAEIDDGAVQVPTPPKVQLMLLVDVLLLAFVIIFEVGVEEVMSGLMELMELVVLIVLVVLLILLLQIGIVLLHSKLMTEIEVL
jgi:hypothetical protein